MNEAARRVERARSILRELGSVVVAFSGGIDSSVVLKLALDELRSQAVVAATAQGEVHSSEERETARAIASRLGARHVVLPIDLLAVPGFSANPPDRCYLCKNAILALLLALASAEGLDNVVDGANADDTADYRPGSRAAKELGVRSPLAEAGIGKEQVRALGRELGLPNWEAPSSPCLASRFPYGEAITDAKLDIVAQGERALKSLGFGTVRLRHHGELARIEVAPADIARATEESARRAIVSHLRSLGYAYVTLDLEGFRSGSLNEVLPDV